MKVIKTFTTDVEIALKLEQMPNYSKLITQLLRDFFEENRSNLPQIEQKEAILSTLKKKLVYYAKKLLLKNN